MAKTAVILAAAGMSSRFGSSSPRERKVFRELSGRAVWLRAAEAFLNHPDVAQVLVVIAPDDLEWFKEKYRANLAFLELELVPGGAERSDSVKNALARVRSDIELVAIHDAARPVISRSLIDRVFEAAQQHGAAVPTVPIAATIKRVEQSRITDTVPRAGLHAAQTPQVFRRKLLLEAYAQLTGPAPTDDAQVVEQSGVPVVAVEGSSLNIKITTAEDLRMAEALLTLLPRSGPAGPLHPFADENPRGLFS